MRVRSESVDLRGHHAGRQYGSFKKIVIDFLAGVSLISPHVDTQKCRNVPFTKQCNYAAYWQYICILI